jgi:UDP-3-O-[3-hydroxymyristoyl] glucosamine N-acyltransferase
MIDETAFIHPLACVDDSVSIGPRCKVWQFSTVIRGTVLGMDCSVASCVTLDGPQIGARCIVSPGVDIGPGFLIGDDVFIGPNVVLCNDAWPRAHKRGWDANELRGLSSPMGREAPAYAVIVENGASIGANATVLPGVRIGARAMVAAGAVVSRDVPPDCLALSGGLFSRITNEGSRVRMRAATKLSAPRAAPGQ